MASTGLAAQEKGQVRQTEQVHSARQVGVFQEFRALHPPGWPRNFEAPYRDVTGTRTTSQPAQACKTAAPTYGSFSLCAPQTGPGSGERHCDREAGKTSLLPAGLRTGTAPLGPLPSPQGLSIPRE